MKAPPFPPPAATPPSRLAFPLAVLILAGVLAALFSRSFDSSQILFSSDGPLGANMAAYARVPAGYTGMWQDLYWVGGAVGSAFPSATYALLWALGPVGFAKFYAPISLLLLGLSVWLFFRQSGFRPVVCLLGGLAAALNTDFLSYACWGLGTLPMAVASVFLGLAALVTPATSRWWWKAALGGLAIGMAVMEGFDSGAILSLYFAAFVLFQSALDPGPAGRNLARGAFRLLVVVLLAGFMAAQALTVLIGTQVQGVVGMQQDKTTKAQRWDQATMWSLPKLETLRVVIPGLFGYRMDTPEGGNYWGGVGQTPGVIQSRHSGSGVYGGVLVAVIAFWAFLQSLRARNSVFNPVERRTIWFWSAALAVSLVLAWGRHAPFYQLLYALPYFSTIRNPIKFMHPFHLALVILFGYGLQGWCRRYLETAVTHLGSLHAQLKSWWAGAPGFDRRWTAGLLGTVGLSVLAWLMYSASRGDLEAFLKQAAPPAELAPAIARFSLMEVGWFVLFLAMTSVVLVLIQSGVLAGRRARWAAVCLGLLTVADFSRANAPWVYYWNREEKYASNPLLDLLRARPHEQRVVMFPFQAGEQLGLLQQFYHTEWIQHQFPYHNVQTLDVVQEPRAAADNVAYRNSFFTRGGPGYRRMLELTSTRFLFGMAGGFADALNAQFDTNQHRFRLHTAFTLQQERAGGPITVATNTTGPFALIEFTGALPKARLYPRWQTVTNEQEALNLLADPAFDPAQSVLVASPLPASAVPAGTNQTQGTVEFASYAPKHIRLQANAPAPALLLLNDKYDSRWQVTVDGQTQPLLRCNYFMRGVFLPAGPHVVEFRFGMKPTALIISLAAIAVGIGLLLFLGVERRGKAEAAGELGGAGPAANSRGGRLL